MSKKFHHLVTGDVVQVKWADAPDTLTVVVKHEESSGKSKSYFGFDQESAQLRKRSVYSFESDQVAAVVGNMFDYKFRLDIATAALKVAQ